MTLVANCRGCHHQWFGKEMAHCALCHHTFSTVSNFDKHRTGGGCRIPAGFRQNDRGTWLAPGERDIQEFLHRRGK